MATRIPETELVIPALWLISTSMNKQTTTKGLIDGLRELLKPQAPDLVQGKNRSDDLFSQKVRNLKSHNTLVDLGYANYSRQASRIGIWSLTAQGQAVVDNSKDLLEKLTDGEFATEDVVDALRSTLRGNAGQKEQKLQVFDENDFVLEGRRTTTTGTTYSRSKKLRDYAINQFKVDGAIICKVCGFDFKKCYGEIGTDYIEIHHIKPIVTLADDNEQITFQNAIANLAPLCANCHRMLHHGKHPILDPTILQPQVRIRFPDWQNVE